jgi:hypothetical protein
MKIQLVSNHVQPKSKGQAQIVVHDTYFNKKRKANVNTSRTCHVRIEHGGAYSFVNALGETEVLVPAVV